MTVNLTLDILIHLLKTKEGSNFLFLVESKSEVESIVSSIFETGEDVVFHMSSNTLINNKNKAKVNFLNINQFDPIQLKGGAFDAVLFDSIADPSELNNIVKNSTLFRK